MGENGRDELVKETQSERVKRMTLNEGSKSMKYGQKMMMDRKKRRRRSRVVGEDGWWLGKLEGGLASLRELISQSS